ncbi:SDR family NAD(P)-dependent oxidoreductase [Neorhizobium sp. JUb45]|uniref:SDR family NAD(P)-dependent oxidoreductase n=1 Tax=Neorhizobium sp. JUb45 TaxID=2485113 RepID=UPI00104ED8DF|nr:SDR family NAD(P)-dependent oxidoreductase [Neorhizobium sp. JUb45]TCQ99104.1 NADP-dependent 3-hydroxy acid dehydrogenase YdfG [Neorhizobium sp. JUb45]
MTDRQPETSRGSVLVAGAGSIQGVGAAITRRFGREGHSVLMAGRNEEKLLTAAAELKADGIDVHPLAVDLSRPEDVRRAVEAAQALAPLEIAVHNAGSNRPAPFLEQAEDEFETHWREHALGGYNLARASLPVLLSNGADGNQGQRASLIFTGASGSLRGNAGFAAFSAAKGALRNLSQSLAREFGPKGVHVAHVVIDGGINGERLLSKRPELRDSRGEDGLLNIDAIAEAYWTLHHQHRSAWTQELDLRPWSESF